MPSICWGNNVFNSIDPRNAAHTLLPIKVDRFDQVLWTSWVVTIGIVNGRLSAWGKDRICTEASETELEASVAYFLGSDDLLGYVDDKGIPYTFEGEKGMQGFRTICATQKQIYAFDDALHCFESFSDLLKNESACGISHPAINPKHEIRLYATESRAFLLVRQHQLFEIVTIDERNQICTPALVPIEGLEGYEIKQVVPGCCNRLGILIEDGSAFVLDTRSKEPELLAEEVRLLGIGSDFEVIVDEKAVRVRGKNKFGQLGLPHAEEVTDFIALPDVLAGEVKEVQCSRWGVFMQI